MVKNILIPHREIIQVMAYLSVWIHSITRLIQQCSIMLPERLAPPTNSLSQKTECTPRRKGTECPQPLWCPASQGVTSWYPIFQTGIRVEPEETSISQYQDLGHPLLSVTKPGQEPQQPSNKKVTCRTQRSILSYVKLWDLWCFERERSS